MNPADESRAHIPSIAPNPSISTVRASGTIVQADSGAFLLSGIPHMALLFDRAQPDSVRLSAGWRAGRLMLPRTRVRSNWAPGKRACCMVIRAQISSFSSGALSRPGVHAANTIGGYRRAAILCMITANKERGIATSAI